MVDSAQNFSLYQGDDGVFFEITVNDSTGSAIDITSATFEWAFVRTPQGAPLVTKTLGSGITLSDPTHGKLKVTFAAADTVTRSGDYFHELVMVLGGVTETVAVGTMTVNVSTLK